MIVTPGYGTTSLHLRQDAEDLRTTFGEPTGRTQASSLREYWLYPEKHFDCIVSRKSGKVLTLFLYSGNPFGATEIFGLSVKKIRDRWGNPSSQGGGYRLDDGSFVKSWWAYDNGVGVDFDEAGKVDTVSIFAKTQSSKVKVPTKQTYTLRPQLAALRR